MIRRYDTNTRPLYTYFNFEELKYWEDFDLTLNTIKKLNYCIIYQRDIVWIRLADCEKNGFPFRLLYHEDYGVLLHSVVALDENYYSNLQLIADEINSKMQDTYGASIEYH